MLKKKKKKKGLASSTKKKKKKKNETQEKFTKKKKKKSIASEFYKHVVFQTRACKAILLRRPKHGSRSLPKALPRSERGREKAATFFPPLSKMAEGRGIAATSSSEEERCSPSPLRGGLGDSASIDSPRFPLVLTPNALCPISRLPGQTNGVQLCCQSTRIEAWATVQGGEPPPPPPLQVK